MKKLLSLIFFILFSGHGAAWSQGTFNWEFAGWYGGGTYPNVEFDPSVQNRVYLTSDVDGIWRSDDLGNHWYHINNGLGGLMVPQVAIAPTNSNILYATTNVGVYYSLNAGQSWNASDTANGKMTFIRPQNYRSLAIDPTNPQHVCVGTQSQQLYCSSNYGQSWQNIPLPAAATAQPAAPIPAMFITRDGKNLYMATSQVVLEYNFGKSTWTTLGQFNNITDMIEDKFLNRVYIASGSSFSYMSEYMPGSWVSSNPIPAGIVYRIALMHPTNMTVQVYVSWWNATNYTGGVMAYQDPGGYWLSLDYNFFPDQYSDPTRVWASISTVQESLKVDPFNHNVLFRTDNWGVWRSDYGGYSWNERVYGAQNVVASDIAIDTHGNIYVGTMDDGLLESTNGGKSYTAIFPTTYANNTAGEVWRVAAIGSVPRIVATSSPWNVNYNQVIVSENGGQSFQIINNGIPTSGRPSINTLWGQGYPRALAVDGSNPNTIYMGIDGDDGGGLFVSTNGGYSWSQTPGQPGSKEIYHALAVNPANPNNIIWGCVGNNGGIYLSTDKGRSFKYVESS
ncbi:MAG: hypothetical protein KGJ11_03120, partial [Candidatus Omnitrophica bacterium]|nr:hypothetical protein [Candidatus Omnitrophota bacterium]